MSAPGTGPAGPHLTPDEWLVVHAKLSGRVIPPSERRHIGSARGKIGEYITMRSDWVEDAQRRKLDKPY